MCAANTYTLTGPDGQRYESPTLGTLGGHRRGKLYGRLDCPAALRAIAHGGYTRHRVFFADESTAIAAGYRPCRICLREKYQTWKQRQAGKTPPLPSVERSEGTTGFSRWGNRVKFQL